VNPARRTAALASLAGLPLLLALAGCAGLRAGDGPAAQVEKFELVSRHPAFGGRAFDAVGPYEVVTGVATVRVDPRDARNSVITDIARAAGRDGWVRYQADVVVLRPQRAAHAAPVMVVDLPNRGHKLFPVLVDGATGRLDTAADAGTGFTLRQGYTMVWIGWQGDLALGRGGATLGTALPRVGGRDRVSGAVEEEAEFDDAQPVSRMQLTYPAANEQGELTVRSRAAAAPTVIAGWRWVGDDAIEITRPPRLDGGATYRFRYTARDPKVMGLGLAAVRDVAAWLKAGRGAGNPLADIRPRVALAVGVSQAGRALRDFLWLGLNANPGGGRVFDGAMPLIAGAKKSFTNYRFALPGRNSTQHNEHLTPGDQFPFSYAVTRDPLTGATDGIFARCQASATCPKLMHVDSSTEFWQGRAALVVTDGAGHDIALPDDVRAYLMSSTQHMAALGPPTTGLCKYPHNPAPQGPLVRALLADLVAWTRDGTAPPPSAYPTLADVRLAAPTVDATGFPVIRPDPVPFPQVINDLTVVDYSVVPPRPDPARRYQILVPMVDADGHDIAGVRLPDIAVPLATHTGWNLRRPWYAEDELCGLNGLVLPLPARARPGDPRLAIGQRYPARIEYAKAVALVARDLRDRRLLLQEDVDHYIDQARTEPRVAP
jgi:hypothetical protein